MKQGLAALLYLVITLPSIASAAPPAPAVPQWRQYASADYGFILRYPSTFTVYSGHPDIRETQKSMFPVCDTTTVACFEYNAGDNANTDIQAIGLSVNILRDRKTEAACYTPDEERPAFKPTTIHGILFHTGQTGSAGLGSGVGGDIHRVFHQGVCFEVDVMTAVSNGWSVEDQGPRFPVAKMRPISRDLDLMLHSFTFIGPVKDGPAWSVFSDSGCGSSFEYPDGDTVEQTIPYANGAYLSNAITCAEHFVHAGRDYTVAVKVNLYNNRDPKDRTRMNAWLESAGYPTLAGAQQVLKTENLTEYYAEPYLYVVSTGDVTILSVSDATHQVLSPADDPIFAHLLRTFQQ